MDAAGSRQSELNKRQRNGLNAESELSGHAEWTALGRRFLPQKPLIVWITTIALSTPGPWRPPSPP